jgi:hypothetical protein
VIQLWTPHSRCMGGICLGASRAAALALGAWVEHDDDLGYRLERPGAGFKLSLSDDVVISIGAFQECYLDEINLIGQRFEFAVALVGGDARQTEDGEVAIYEFDGGLEFYVRDDRIIQVHLSDWSLVREYDDDLPDLN